MPTATQSGVQKGLSRPERVCEAQPSRLDPVTARLALLLFVPSSVTHGIVSEQLSPTERRRRNAQPRQSQHYYQRSIENTGDSPPPEARYTPSLSCESLVSEDPPMRQPSKRFSPPHRHDCALPRSWCEPRLRQERGRCWLKNPAFS